MTPGTESSPVALADAHQTFAAVVRSERLKLDAYRSVRVLLVLSVLTMTLTGAVSGYLIERGLADQFATRLDAIAGIPAGGAPPAAYLLAFGSMSVICAEYGAHTLNLSLCVVPNRRLLFLAKATVVLALAAAAGVLGGAGALVAATLTLSPGEVVSSLSGMQVWLNLCAGLVVMVSMSWMAMGLGFLLQTRLAAGVALFGVLVGLPVVSSVAATLGWSGVVSFISLTPGPLINTAAGAASSTSTLVGAMALLVGWGTATAFAALLHFDRHRSP